MDQNTDELILIRGENRIGVHRKTLAKKSRYFACLFSYSSTKDKEHVVNYDISLSTLQYFVEWIHDNGDYIETRGRPIKQSMLKFLNDNLLSDLLNLLQLSILFIVESLTEEVTDIIVLQWLLPEKIIDIWLLAQELGLNTLKDICFSVCLDRFDELPLASLVDLSEENVKLLLGNVYVRSSTSYLETVRNEWSKRHTSSGTIVVRKERKQRFLQGIAISKAFLGEADDGLYVYTWNGSSPSECVQITGKELVGMQVIGRGFSIYTVGGQAGVGTGKFNEVISRYCLISKKWYHQARLPVPRRHMVSVFLRNKLVLAGGVGRHRLKLTSVDILDIHTGEWTKGAEVPEWFSCVPYNCVINGKLYMMASRLYTYDPDQNRWDQLVVDWKNHPQMINGLLPVGGTVFFDDSGRIFAVTLTDDGRCKTNGTVFLQKIDFETRCVPFKIPDVMLPPYYLLLSEGDPDPSTAKPLYVKSEIIPETFRFLCSWRYTCFHVISLSSLYDTDY